MQIGLAVFFSRNVDDKEISIAASRGLPELIQNVNRSSHGHSTPSLKIPCKSVQPFSRNVADKEISIAASRGFSELTQNVMRSSRGHSTPSLKLSCKSVQSFCQNKPFSRNVADKEISIAASRGFSELIQNVIRSSHGQSTPSLKISCKSVQPFCLDTKRHRQTTDRQTDRRHAVPKARPVVRSAKKRHRGT